MAAMVMCSIPTGRAYGIATGRNVASYFPFKSLFSY
jgi:hypothetical protein